MPKRVNQLDLIATELATWIDQVANEISFAMLGGASAPFAARLTDDQKLDYYTRQLFNPDGTPNQPGRNQELARLGPTGFRQVYSAVLKAHPELKPPDEDLPPEETTPTPLPGQIRHPADAMGTQIGQAPYGPPPPPEVPPGLPPGPPMGPPPGLPPGMPPPGMPIPAMAKGGIVTRPTLALIGEAGPEAVVPLGQYQPPSNLAPDYDLQARLGNAPVPLPERDYGTLDTQLSPTDEMQFQQWKAQYAPQDSGYDYDLRGAYQAGLTPDPQTGHWPDAFKKPNHPTFSDQSRYAQAYPNQAGRWAGDTYVPPLGQYQYSGPDPGVAAHLTGPAAPDPDLAARLTGAAPTPPAPPPPTHDEIVAYIQQAAIQRGIDPRAALQVALHEGTNPKTGRFDSPAEEAQFATGRSWWPYQLHYGGPGYEQYGTTAGLGNEFTARTGIQPGDPNAWQASTDFALDQAIANPKGWAQWYGSTPAKVAPRQGLPARRA